MKLISYQTNGQDSYGAVVGDRVVDLRAVFGTRAPDLKALIAAGLVDEARAALASAKAALPLSEVKLLPVVPNPGKIFCIGLNYGEHVRETGKQVTDKPVIFLRVADSQLAHGEDIVRPRVSERLDYEGEIAIVIGQGGRHIAEADAWRHIAGYSCYNDGSVRDWQLHTSQWAPGKNFWRTGGFGPWLVTADEIAPDQQMTLVTRLNGQEMQRATTDMMIHSIPRQIAYISAFIPLEPGDVIVTGTPGGVGNKRTPPVFMRPGDVVEIEVDAIGVLRNGIRDE
ncbi:fumarylacetoacetate hydrolase family protein [Pseudorhodoferax sp. Leaf265]|uniref:fumarylacetoacetate hydrolase family protein n=1 Tax=Pseudorhodoferax sp. Leaf265 TaxID=1736315 RepID=UPI0006F285B7|nr:fumarylacetoacetate hydrolase family protein [Pseudorhodoferax sp. Leaf265]KQP14450.1 5-carboxymethyl-2-hydroxymuconate isomerase [Pseudorhodoferax sp. Leaf265]